jgi:hypothetical protein
MVNGERGYFSPQRPGEMRKMFSGIQPSKGAQELVMRAFAVGINPIEYTIRAGMASLRDGRKKVGPFGSGKTQFDTLKKEIGAREKQKAQYEANGKTI